MQPGGSKGKAGVRSGRGRCRMAYGMSLMLEKNHRIAVPYIYLSIHTLIFLGLVRFLFSYEHP